MAETSGLLLEEEEPKRKKKGGGDGPTDLGPLMFAALAILLLAFFILLVSMATVDTKKRKAALGSVAGAFGLLQGGFGVTQKEGLGVSGPAMTAQARFEGSVSLFRQLVKTKGLEKDVIMQGSRKGFAISLSEGLVFDHGGAELSPKAYLLLDSIKFIIVDGRSRFQIRIEGHTDNEPVVSDLYPSNWELSVARAIAVLRYFLLDREITGDNIEAAGFGKYRPKFPNTTLENRKKNRRVDIIFLLKKKRKDVDPKKDIDIEGFRFSF